MTFEHELIFLCARLEINKLSQVRINELLCGPINWNKIIELSNYQEILPLVYFSLNKLNFQNIIPQDIFRQLKNSYYLNLYRNTKIEKEILSVLNLLERNCISIIPFKGFSLIQTLYHNPALRIMDDVDILMKDRFQDVRDVLIQLDYQPATDKNYEVYLHKYQYEILFSKKILPNLSIHIEIHPEFVPARPYKINLPQLWMRTQKISVHGQEVLCLSPEDTFLSLVLHLRRNTRTLTLKFIVDIAELLNINKNKFDWIYVKESARNNHIITTVYVSLYLAKELLQADISSEILNRFGPDSIKMALINFTINKSDFLNFTWESGIFLRLLLFDSIKDFFLYLWRVSLFERFFAPYAISKKIKRHKRNRYRYQRQNKKIET